MTSKNQNFKPKYLDIYYNLRSQIIKGEYKTGSKLPSKRVLSEDLSVSTITVEHAYGLLEEEGYIESRERSGYFVVFKKEDGFMAQQNPVFDLDIEAVSHSTEEFPLSVMSKTMRKVITDYGEAMMAKSPNTGCAVLKDAIKNYLARSRNIHTNSDRIIIGSGAEYLYGLIVKLLGKNALYGVEYPSYEKIVKVYQTAGARTEFLPLLLDGISSESLKTTKASVLHITPYRSFPTGITASASKRHEYIRWANLDNRYIVEDDFESEFSLSSIKESTLFSLADHDNIIYVNSFSKTISPSLRIAYMVLPEKLMSKFYNTLGFYSCTVPTFFQLVVAELLSSGDFERHVNRVRRNKRKALLK
ncbi:MAG: PLP-dependent aminotransferase family protein [Clostridia bacterium]|nr:PLP-dependent aminotransferase family protein [Clostridia bacterium]